MPGKAKNAENRSVEKGPAEELGMLSTVEQIAKLNHHRSILHGSKARIWQKYIFKRCAKRQVAIEQDVTMYNLIGQTRTFFVEEGDADKKVYASLLRALELWVSLIVAGKLHLVFQHEDYKSVGALTNQGGTPAEVFRAYIRVHKSRVGIKDWKKESMDNVRYALYQVVLKAREEGKAPQPTGANLSGKAYKTDMEQPLQVNALVYDRLRKKTRICMISQSNSRSPMPQKICTEHHHAQQPEQVEIFCVLTK